MLDSSPEARLARAQASLEGLSVGDAFGQRFFMSFELAAELMESGEFGDPPYNFEDEFILSDFIDPRRIPPGRIPWLWTDDTAMAIEIVKNLAFFGRIDPDGLAKQFSRRYTNAPGRGYGGAMHSLLPQLRTGRWQDLSSALFEGSGSYGNGTAMRAAPIGAYFADDIEAAVHHAALSSKVTHYHSEGVAGGVAVAVAAVLAAQEFSGEPTAFLTEAAAFVPPGETKTRILRAAEMDDAWTPEEVALELGSGEAIAAWDTVPFCLWCVAHNQISYEEALWNTLAGLGDRDTTCAITGGIMAAALGTQAIPPTWLASREPLD